MMKTNPEIVVKAEDRRVMEYTLDPNNQSAPFNK